jgi:hypothetical protein
MPSQVPAGSSVSGTGSGQPPSIPTAPFAAPTPRRFFFSLNESVPEPPNWQPGMTVHPEVMPGPPEWAPTLPNSLVASWMEDESHTTSRSTATMVQQWMEDDGHTVSQTSTTPSHSLPHTWLEEQGAGSIGAKQPASARTMERATSTGLPLSGGMPPTPPTTRRPGSRTVWRAC